MDMENPQKMITGSLVQQNSQKNSGTETMKRS